MGIFRVLRGPQILTAVAGVGFVLTMAGCGTDETGAQLPTQTPTPTVEVGFVVNVTPVVTEASNRRTVRPTATSFVPPHGPYIVLRPSVGPPSNRTITVVGGNLQHNSQISLVWVARGHISPLATTSFADGRGKLYGRFTVPATPPGWYSIEARVNGVVQARAQYHVVSRAVLGATASPGAAGEIVQVSGRRFLHDTRFLLAAYPVFPGAKPVSLGVVRASDGGRFTFTTTTKKLRAGEYLLRAWSLDFLTVEMANVYFQVLV